MRSITVTRRISAAIGAVFQAASDVREFAKAIPHIVNVEFLSESRTGAGTRFRETRTMNGKEQTTELEVTEFVENERVRMVADSHGAIWDTVFTVKQTAEHVEMTMVMEARPYKLIPKIMYLLFRGMIQKAVEKDMDAVKTYCER
jgi:hypothetical protein